MKNVLMTTALVTALAAPAAFADNHAEATDAATATDATAMTAQGDMFVAQPEEGALLASDLMGMSIHAVDGHDADESEGVQENWEDVGEISDFVTNTDGEINAVLVDIGGFLGIGERRVALSMDSLKFVSDTSTDDADDFLIVVPTTREALENAPEFEMEDDAEVEVEAQTDETTVDEAGADTVPAVDEAKTEDTDTLNDDPAVMDETDMDTDDASTEMEDETEVEVEEPATTQ